MYDMRILDYRLVIIDNEGEINKYPFSFGMQHKDCQDDYAEKKGYDYSGLDYLVGKGNCIFYNCGENIVVAKLPSILDEKQLYTLDYIENCLDDVSLLQITKGFGKDEVHFNYVSDIKEQFSREVVQSYYDIKNKKR